MKSQSYERLWPPLLKLKFGNGWLTSNCCSSCCKKINSGFQFQFQFQGFEFQFHFQFHQFQFQFQFRNWNWAAIPIPELNAPNPGSCGSVASIPHGVWRLPEVFRIGSCCQFAATLYLAVSIPPKKVVIRVMIYTLSSRHEGLGSVWYKTKFGCRNFGYQLWCLFCNISNVFKNMFNVGLIIMW